jgi:single-strand DNA-binding protein
MASSLNKVQLIGRLGKDPEVRSTQTGRTVTTITLATSETFGKDADRKERTEWHKIILWDKLGQIAGNYLRKGRQVYVEGRITYRDYMDRDNIKRYTTEIVATTMVFLGSKDESGGAGRAGGTAEPNSEYAPEPAADFSAQDIDKYAASMQNLGGDDEVPF